MTSSSLAPTYPASSLPLQLESVEQGRALNLESLTLQSNRKRSVPWLGSQVCEPGRRGLNKIGV